MCSHHTGQLEKMGEAASLYDTPDSRTSERATPAWHARSIEREVERIESEIAACHLCHRMDDVGKVQVQARGNTSADLLLVGEGPGAAEEKARLPFVGRSGVLLQSILAHLDLDCDHGVFISNLVRCRAVRKVGGHIHNKRPNRKQQANCVPYLIREVLLVRPRIVVLLGTVVCRHFLGREFQLGRDHGTMHSWHSLTLLPTYHPAAILQTGGDRQRELRLDFEADLAKAKGLLIHEPP